MLVLHVVEAVPALDAQPARVRRPVLALDEKDPVLLDVIRELATHAAIGADRLDPPVFHDLAYLASRHERAGRTRLDAFTTGHASGIPHWIVQVEDDLRMRTSERVADYVVHLLLATGPHTASALNAGVEVHCDRGMRRILRRLLPGFEAGLANRELPCPMIQL